MCAELLSLNALNKAQDKAAEYWQKYGIQMSAMWFSPQKMDHYESPPL